jgi:hypothetical protein
MWRPFEPRRTVRVFMGEELDANAVQAALRACESVPATLA